MENSDADKMDSMAKSFLRLTPREQDELQIIGMVWNNGANNRDAAKIVEECLEVGLRPEHFYRESHKFFWEAIVESYEAGRPLTWEAILAGKKLKAHWPVEICDILVNAPLAESAVWHANHIIALANAEKIAVKASDLASAVLKRDADNPQELSDFAATTWDQLVAVDAVKTGRVNLLYDSINQTIDEIEEAIKNKMAGENNLIKTGLQSFDQKYGGINRQGFHILGARPGVGKTTVALNIAIGAATAGNRVLYFTYEMAHTELTTKLISQRSGIPSNKMRRGEFDEVHTAGKFAEGARKISNLPIGIDDKSMPDWNIVERRIRQHAKSYKLSLVIIDYIQQLTCPSEKWMSRVQELTYITGRIKSLSQELRIAILGCAQLNREAERSAVSYPTLSMLKDCGSLEQDADIVMFVHRGDDDENSNEGLETHCDLIVEKHRHDQAGIVFPLKMNLSRSLVTTNGDWSKLVRRKKEDAKPSDSFSASAGRK